MLEELHLQNLAVTEDATLRLSPGLNALTGSTGAGKSLVVEALRWLRGEPIDRGLLREGASHASAEALFDLRDREDLVAELDALGLPVAEDRRLRLRREVRSEGRSRAWIDARVTSAAVLAEVTDRLVRLQSQHQQLSLLDPTAHVDLLDAGGVDPALRERWREAFARERRIESEIAALLSERQRHREQREILQYQFDELTRARLEGDELEDLRRRVARLEGGARLTEGAAAAAEALEDEQVGALAALRRAALRLRSVPEEIGELVEAREQLTGAIDLATDASAALESFLSDRDVDPRALERAQERLAELNDLVRKYSRTEPELIELRDRLGRQLEDLDPQATLPAELLARRRAAQQALDEAARQLHRVRKSVARHLERDAPALLADLGMPGAALRFDFLLDVDKEAPVRVEGRGVRPRPEGPAAVRLSVRTNPGERFGPVEKVASGGELSRIGLVLRSLAVRREGAALLVLDEVDTGLGADLGPALSRRLRALAQTLQVLVITHLPAVAAAADRHLVAVKGAADGRTRSRIDRVEGPSRVDELARMIGGDHRRTAGLAAEMLAAAGEERRA